MAGVTAIKRRLIASVTTSLVSALYVAQIAQAQIPTSQITTSQTTGAQLARMPDFSSNRAAWGGAGSGDFLAVPGSPLPITQDPRYPRIGNAQSRRTGEQVTYRIGDLSNPNLREWARDIMQKDSDEILAGKIAFASRSSCMPAGVPNFVAIGGGLLYILQSPDLVLMLRDGNAQMRRIYLNAPHSENPAPSWYGDSVGHYEGDTLVIDTIGLNDRSFVDSYRTPHTEKLHVIERWRLVEGGERIDVHISVDDPGTFNQPWQAIRSFEREQAIYGEEICAENNQHVFDYGVPTDNTPDF
nr:MAG: hypothetical protein E4H34_04680 [Hyphomicrobiales bacterium]